MKDARDVIAFIGYRKLNLKSDGGPAIAALEGAIKAPSDVEMEVEVSPVGNSESNCEIERAARIARG